LNYTPFRHLGALFWKRRPLQLTVFLTRRCNSRCRFCFYLSAGHRGPSDELSGAELARIADSTGSLLWLAFSGGEIFLRDDLVEITRIFYERSRPAIILLPSNGLLPERIFAWTKEILDRCPKSTVVVKLSIDGPPPLHDRMRGIPGGHAKTMATYEALAELLGSYRNFDLGINTVFCRANQEAMSETIDEIGKLPNVRTHTVSLIRGEMADAGQKKIDLEKYRQASGLLAERLRARIAGVYRFPGGRLKAAQDILQRKMIYETALASRALLPCYAGRLNAVVTETGDVYPCESFTRKIGNIRESEYDLRQMLRTPEAQHLIDSINAGGCSCTHECYMMTNILFNPRMAPALLREYLRL